jgi:outer membrane protein
MGLAFALPLARSAEPTVPEVLTLAEAQTIALRNHPKVAIAQLRELVAQEEVKRTRAAYFPTLDGYVDAVDAGNNNTRILAGGLNNPSIYDRVADGAVITQLITDFGQTSNFTASAKLSAKAAHQATAATDEEILLSVDLNYFNGLQAQAVLTLAQQTLQARQLLVNQVTALAKNLLRSELDVSFAAVALEESRLLLQKSEADAANAQAGLAAALGYRESRHFVLSDESLPANVVPDVETLVATALDNRPDLLKLRYQRDSSQHLAQAQKDRNYPTVAAVGTAGNAIVHDDRLPNRYAAVGVQVDIPLFAGGAYIARQRQAELEARVADQTLRDQEDLVSRDVRVAWSNFKTSLQRLQTTEQLVKHANQAYSLAQVRYKVGSSSIVELNDAQLGATSAQIGEVTARYDELIQRAILTFQTGTLGESARTSAARTPPEK